ncbi:MAG: hydrogenase maturation protease [Planctomycetaceae bacterium]
MARIVIGCGNTLVGDDGAGPFAVAALAARPLPPDVRLLDAGTAGIDAALGMAGAAHVILVDACRSGAPPGTLLEWSDLDPAACPAPAGIDLHGCRWDQALALARLSWGGRPPARIDAILVEGASFVPGDGLSEPVRRGVERAAARILALLAGVPGPGGG